MPQETDMIKAIMKVHKVETQGQNTYYIGELNGVEVILATSGWGKSLAASTATVLIVKYGVEKIIFTGVAGAVKNDLKIGDIVIGKNYFYHDMDTRPIFPKFHIPHAGKAFFYSKGYDEKSGAQCRYKVRS